MPVVEQQFHDQPAKSQARLDDKPVDDQTAVALVRRQASLVAPPSLEPGAGLLDEATVVLDVVESETWLSVRKQRYFADEVGRVEMSFAANGWSGRLLLADGFVAYHGAGSQAEEHAHYAVQLVWGLGHNVEVTTGGETHVVGATLIPSHVPHAFSAATDPLLVLLVEPTGRRGRLLNSIATQHPCMDLERHLAAIAAPALTADAGTMRSWCERLIDIAIASAQQDLPEPGELRREVTDTLTYINNVLPEVPRLTAAASSAGISASRLTHLFTTQVGIPFRRFVLWARIRLVTQQVQAGWNLTDAAASAGFADSAHFTRVFHAMFGLAPSAILPHLEIVGQLGEQ